MTIKPLPKTVQKILEQPYAVKTPAGDMLRFRSMAEAHLVSYKCGWVYYVYLIDARSWVPIGIIWKMLD